MSFRLVASILISAVLLLVGAATVPDAAAEDTKPIVIGGSLGITGQFARMGQELDRGLELWAEEVNSHGGLIGRPVTFKVYDDQSDPTTSAKLYERLIVEDKVDLLFSAFSSPVVFAASAVTEKYKFPMVAAGGSAQNIWERGFRYIFQIYPQPEGQLAGLIDVARTAGIKSAAVAAEDTNYTKETAQVFMKMAKARGIDIVFYEQYGKNPSDLSALVLKIKALHPDLFFGATYFPESVLLMRHAKELDFNPKLYAFTIGPALDDFVANLKKDAEMVAGISFWEVGSRYPGSQDFVRRYQVKYKALPAYQAAASYGSMQILEAAVRKVGSLDREKIRDALASLEFQSVFGIYKVDDKGAQLANHSFVFQIQDGQRKIVWPPEIKDTSLIFPVPPWSDRK